MRHRPILMLVGGGLEHGGGIGRLVGYVTKAWNREIYPPITVVDPRGPDRILLWPFFLIKSIFQIIGRSPQRPLVHIHLAANSSTLRKLILANLSRLLRLDFVIHLHDPLYPDFYNSLPRWARSLVRSMFIRAERVIVLGKPAAAMVNMLIGVPRDRVDILPNAVPGPAKLERATTFEASPETSNHFSRPPPASEGGPRPDRCTRPGRAPGALLARHNSRRGARSARIRGTGGAGKHREPH